MQEKNESKKKIPVSSRPKAQDVARLAGVSRTQVSFVLNETRTAHVSPERRKRILKAAEDLGYRPHTAAQALRRGFSNEFSIFFPAPYPPLINSMIGAIHEHGLQNNCVPIQYSFNSYEHKERLKESFSMLLNRRPLGMFCSLIDITWDEIELARKKGVSKILVFDIEPHDEIETLHLPTETAGYMAARHLIQRGHRRIGIISPADPVQNRAFTIRCAGIQKAIAEFGGTELIVLPWPAENIRPTLEYAEIFVDRFLRISDPPTAIYAFSDNYALPVLAVLNRKGIDVPGSTAVIGTDDLEYGAFIHPDLTTIRFDTADLGERAVAMINSLITGEPVDERFGRPPQPVLVQRGST